MYEQIIINFEKVSYWKRVYNSLKSNNRFFKYLAITFVVALSTIHIHFPYGILMLISLYALFFFSPILFVECKNYIYFVRMINNEIEIKYQSFNKDKLIIVKQEQMRIVELNKGNFSFTVTMFRIYEKLSKNEVKYLVNQYKILNWSDVKSIEKLRW